MDAPNKPNTRPAEGNSELHELRIRGRVEAFQERREPDRGFGLRPKRSVPTYVVIWNFRLVRTGPDGKALPPVAVEMRGLELGKPAFEGSLVNGDEVEVDAPGHIPGDIIHPLEVRNLSSNCVVRGRTRSIVSRVLAGVFLIIGLVIIVTVAAFIISQIKSR
ncbi:MAG TPA: hypothetical protein VES66_04300 [Terriglobales bacterium]|nr:hypothetical protein [Terriglobales bacterium]